MFPEKTQSRAKRSGIAHEEERAWIGFYRRVAHDAALATEVLGQLESDPEMRRAHLALYLCCKESLRTHKARQLRNKQIGQFVRWLCASLVSQVFVHGPRAVRRGLRRGADLVVACLPERGKEPALAQVRRLTEEPAFASAQAEFLEQRAAASAGLADVPSEAGTTAQPMAVRKSA